MWKEITDAQRDGREWLVGRNTREIPVTAKYDSEKGVWGSGIWYYVPECAPTHYWDFGLGTPLPLPPNGGENE